MSVSRERSLGKDKACCASRLLSREEGDWRGEECVDQPETSRVCLLQDIHTGIMQSSSPGCPEGL